jgi:SAM-dependent methyltransferase
MSPIPRPKPSIGLLRSIKRLAQRTAGLFFNLDAVENALLDGRLIEYPFVLKKLAGLPKGKVLDIGCANSSNYLLTSLAALGWEVYGIDIRDFKLEYPNFHFVKGDIRSTTFPNGFFDCVYAVSTLDHLGLAGRYSVRVNDADADIKAITEIGRILRPGGIFLVTVPYGEGKIIKPMERIYDRARLEQLFSGWEKSDEAYYRQDSGGRWQPVPEEVAARTKSPGDVAIALLELRRP